MIARMVHLHQSAFARWSADEPPTPPAVGHRRRAACSDPEHAEAADFADQALAALRDAFQAGWGQPDELKEPDFDAIRKRADFQKLPAELEARAKKP
jgi:hypothetical protein